MTEREINQKVAEEICSTNRLNGQVFQQDECVGLLDGKVVVVAKDLKTVFDAVRSLDSNPTRGMAFQVRPLLPDCIR